MSVTKINIEELKEMINAGGLEIIDIREPYEHEDYHIKGDKLIPMSMIPLKIEEIDWTKKVVLYCQTGARSAMIANLLSSKGKDVYDLSPGAYMWYAGGNREFIEASTD